MIKKVVAYVTPMDHATLKHVSSFRYIAFISIIPDAKKTVSYLTQTCIMNMVVVVWYITIPGIKLVWLFFLNAALCIEYISNMIRFF